MKLPSDAEVNNIKCKFLDGVLHVYAPRSDVKVDNKVIEIEA